MAAPAAEMIDESSAMSCLVKAGQRGAITLGFPVSLLGDVQSSEGPVLAARISQVYTNYASVVVSRV
jgi:hypothetical protein